MAGREALGAFQRRLADRLHAAPSDPGTSRARWLAVEAGGDHYLLPLAQCGEIFPVAGVQALPYTHPWFLGVANLRGGLFGVVDLALFIAREPRPRPVPGAAPTAPARLVALGASLEVQCALRVDRLAGLRGPDDFSATTPDPHTGPDGFGPCHVDAAGTCWQELSLVALAQQPRFLLVST